MKLVDGTSGAALALRSISLSTTWSSSTAAVATTTATLGYTTDRYGKFVLNSPATSASTGTMAVAINSAGLGGYALDAAASSMTTTFKW